MIGKRAPIFVGSALILLAVFAAYSDGTTIPLAHAATDRPIIDLRLRVGDSLERYIEDNSLNGRLGPSSLDRKTRIYERQINDDWATDYLTAQAGSEGVDDPGGITLIYDHPQCPLELPAGRQIEVSFIGGFVSEMDAILPLDTLLWTDMQDAAASLIDTFDSAGWTRTAGRYGPKTPVKEQLQPSDFTSKSGRKWARIGYWSQCGRPGIKAYLEAMHVNSMSDATMTPPAVFAPLLENDREDRFLLRVRIFAEYKGPAERKLTRLKDARRFAETGSRETAIPLSIWLEDPDWRPEEWDGTLVP